VTTGKYETDTVSKTLCSLSFRTLDEGQSPKTQSFQKISKLSTHHDSNSRLCNVNTLLLIDELPQKIICYIIRE
jgi:hypothetical protein